MKARAIISLICGLYGVLVWILPLMENVLQIDIGVMIIFALPICIFAIILGSIAMKKIGKNGSGFKIAVTGFILGIVGFILALLPYVFYRFF
ncbi:MAG: hypothetical protein FWD48_04665 [Oscillospiraceae bacterium]|nr:hypothetical protein [Oscillospiraceae bacterium]